MNTYDYNGYFSKQHGYKLTEKGRREDLYYWYGFFKKIRRHVEFKNGKYLEFGCGIGTVISILKNHYKIDDIHATELDADLLTMLKSEYPDIRVTKDSIASYGTDATYDYILAFEVLEHLDKPLEDLKKIHSLLKAGGVFIASTPYPYRKNIVSDESHLFVLHPENWLRLLKRAGFTKVLALPATPLPYLYRFNKRFSVIFPFYMPGIYKIPFVTTTILIAAK